MLINSFLAFGFLPFLYDNLFAIRCIWIKGTLKKRQPLNHKAQSQAGIHKAHNLLIDSSDTSSWDNQSSGELRSPDSSQSTDSDG